MAIALRARGARNILLKLGDKGAYIDLVSRPALEVPARQVAAIDTTAAGDTYNGAFAAALVDGWEIEQCALFAAAAAALSVTRAGAQASMPSLSEVIAFMKREECVQKPAQHLPPAHLASIPE